MSDGEHRGVTAATSGARNVALSSSGDSNLDHRGSSEAPARANTQHSLRRETFSTSRLLDFCSERELVKQIGHGVDQWPLVIFKELTDNALMRARRLALRR